MSFAPQPPLPDKAKRDQPHFEIEVEDGRGRLHLKPRTFFGWLALDALSLTIPAVTFPLDITGGMAQFQRQRCPLDAATMRVHAGGLGELIRRRGQLLAAAGFEEVSAGAEGGVLELSARARLRDWAAELIVRVAVEAEERMVRLRVVDAATLGYIRRPASLLAHDLLCILGNASGVSAGDRAPGEAVAVGLGQIELRPLDWFAVAVLAPAGWRLPDLEGVRLERIAVSGAGIELGWARATANGQIAAAAGERGAGAASPKKADGWVGNAMDDALLRNDLAGAATACRLELVRRPERAEALTARLLNILASRDASLRDAETLAHNTLARWPDFAASHLTLAAVETSRGRGDAASRHFTEAARLAELVGDVALAARAIAAAARQLHGNDPARAAQLYERVLRHRPADREAVDALAELYAAAGRWNELRDLLQARVAASSDADRVEAHLRVAELSFLRLREPATARVHLQAAAELAPLERRVWELMAQVCAAVGDTAELIIALERLAAVLAHTDDVVARARALLRTAGAYEDARDDVAALARYREALALTPDDAAALEHFATVAARHGDGADAIDAYRRILGHPRVASDRRSRVEQQLLQLLVIVGDLEGARRTLPSMQDEPAPDTLIGLARLEEAADAYAAAADLWLRAAAQLEGQHAAAAELERARVCRAGGMAQEERAALTRAFALAPTSQDALAAASGLIRLAREAGDAAAEAAWLDRLLSCEPRPSGHTELALRRAQLFLDAHDPAGAAQLLEPIHASGQNGVALRRMLADVRGALGDGAGRAAALEQLAGEVEGAARAQLLVDAAQSRLGADDVDAAADDVQAAEAAAPDEPRVRVIQAEIAWRRRAWEDVAVRYGELVGEASGAARTEYARRLAVGEDRLGRSADALATLAQAVALEDAGGAALLHAWQELGHLHERQGDFAAAVEHYRRGGADARLAPAGARVELWRAAAGILHRRLGRHDDAIAALGAALALDGSDLPTLDALDAIQSEAGDDDGLLATLERKLASPALAAEQRCDALGRLGELAAARGLSDAARAAFAELYALDPTHAGALRWLSDDAAARGDETTLEALDARVAASPGLPAEQQRAARLRRAERARRGGRLADAEVDLWAAVELTAPEEQPPLLVELETLYTEGERWADLVVLLNHHAPLLADAAERRALDLRRVRILAGQLGTPNLAVEAAQQALERYGRDAAMLEALAEAARAAGDERVLADTRAAQAESAELAADAAGRLRFIAEAAALYRALGDTAAAQALARKLTVAELVQFDDATARAEALTALVQAARAAGDETVERDALVALWKDGHAGDDRSRLLTLLQRSEDQDGAAAVAFELFEAERARGGALAVALEPVRATAHSTEALGRLARALTSSAAAADGGEAEAWLREAATIHGDLGDFTAAADVLVTALARWPANETLFADIERLLEDLGDRVRLREVLEQHLDTRVDEARLPTLRKLVRVCEELADEAAVQSYLAEERRLEPASAARVNMQTLVRTVVPDGGRPSAAALEEAIATAEAELDGTPADEVLAIRAARRRLGELYREAGRFGESYDLLETVLSEEPDNDAVLAVLVEVAYADGRWLETAQLLDRLSHLVAAPAARAALLHRAGDLHLIRLRNKDAASTAYLEAIDLDPTHVPTVRRLIDYFFSEADWASTAEMAATLDDEGGFAVDETGTGTRARAALATALAGDARRAVTLGAALDDGGGAAALAQAALELVARGQGIEVVGDTLALISGIGGRCAVVRQRLAERGASDRAAAALAAHLGR